MATWNKVVATAPDLAGSARQMFAVRKHATMATIALDGSPRISGTEVEFADDGIYLGMMTGARRAADLRRDARLSVHSPTVDPPEDNPADWPGEAKIVGRAVEVGDPTPAAESHRFRLDIDSVVLTRISADGKALEITRWTPGTVSTFRRT